MAGTLEGMNELDRSFGADFVPQSPEETDRLVGPETALAAIHLLKGEVAEPFGTDLAVEAPPVAAEKGTAGPTAPKGGNQYDDAKTASE